jgi:hypothetical protein
MKYLRNIILFIIIGSFFCSSNRREFNLKDACYHINGIQDYSFLKEKLEEKDIVFICEGLYDYTDENNSRLQMIKYLHEELGFDVILFDRSFYDMYDLNNVLSNSMPLDTAVSIHCNGMFSESHYRLLEYVDTCKKSGEVFELGGLGISTEYSAGIWSNHHAFDLLYNCDSIFYKSAVLKEAYKQYCFKIDSVEHLDSIFISIDNEVKSNRQFMSDSLFDLWEQVFMNYKASFYYDFQIRQMYLGKYERSGQYLNDIVAFDQSRYCDSIMSRNLFFHKKQYKDKKIIVLTSAFHGRKSVEPFVGTRLIANETKNLGEHVAEFYQGTYHIAWIYDKVEMYGYRIFRNPNWKRSKESLEHYLSKQKIDRAFIDLHTLTNNGDSVFCMYPFWHLSTKGQWDKAFDAVVFSSESLRTTYIRKPENYNEIYRFNMDKK